MSRHVVLTGIRRSSGQAVRYVLVGLIVYGFDLGTFLLLAYVQAAPGTANVVAKAAGAVVGYMLHNQFTFSDGWNWRRSGVVAPDSRGFLRYCALFAANAGGTTILLLLALDYFRFNAVPTRIAVDFLSIAFAFLVCKYFVFTR
jgi:putative flippase GtrA